LSGSTDNAGFEADKDAIKAKSRNYKNEPKFSEVDISKLK
jgi:hypothetical protein